MEIMIRGHRLRKRRAVIALTTLIVIITGTVMLSMSLVNAAPVKVEPEPKASSHEEAIATVHIEVKSGDTAWEIQERLTPEGNLEELMKDLNGINGKDVSHIKAGEVIEFVQFAK